MNQLHIVASWQRLLSFTLALSLALVCSTLYAKDLVAIENAWVRPSAPGQDVGAAYMTLISPQNASLVHVESDVTKSVEIHSMVMQNGVMKMRMLEKLPLTANKAYRLAPGGFHLMLFDLQQPLTQGQQVEFTLTFKLADNHPGETKSKQKRFKQKLKVPVKLPVSDEANKHDHQHHH